MSKSLLSAALALSMASANNLIVHIPSVAQSSSCDAAISWVRRDIMERLGVSARIESRPVRYSDNPFPQRNKEIWIIYGEPSYRGSLSDDDLMRRHQQSLVNARHVIENCKDVSIVVFGLDAPGLKSKYFLFADGSVLEGTDLFPELPKTGQHPQWGYYY
ncbi:hypothetical protein [Parathermosynechococcus lividus]